MNAEARISLRKPLRCQAMLLLPGSAPIRGKTKDISLGGVCAIVSQHIPAGQVCALAFEALLNGKMVRVTANTKVVYSILAGTEGFRTGLQFVQIDSANNATLVALMS
jgi:c-di-GMP-binding flagellar brake protein YcgR